MHNVIARSSPVLLVIIAVAALLTVGGARRSHAADAAPAAKKAAPAQKGRAQRKAAGSHPVPAKEALKEMVEGEDVREFRVFCDSWMQKLRDRDNYNGAHIAWEKGRDGGVVGEYVSYGTDRTCIAREEPGKDPIGKITYREIRYRRQGATPTAAMSGASTIVEQTDVTEIFRYGKGRWQY
jgi:hypothetical protein